MSLVLGGKYAAFVLGAYAVSAAIFAWMVVDTLIRARAARLALQSLEAEHGRSGNAT